jgi:arsenate reductase (thioredoxin)
MKKVLFVCVHNAARSQMAEAFLNRLGKGLFIAESAGLEPGYLNPDIVDVMQEIGYDISQSPTKSVFEFYRQGKKYHYVVKVCDQINGQKCPIFPATLKVLDWNHEDPSQYSGDKNARLAQARILRDEIKHNVEEMINRELLQSANFKSLDLVPLDFVSAIPNQSMILDVEHLLLVDANNDTMGYGVLDSMFDNPRFKLESYASSAITNWILTLFGKSMLSTYELSAFNVNHLTGLLNRVADYVQFRPTDIGLNLTECIQNFAYDKEFNVKTKYRSTRNDDELNIDLWVDFIFSSLNEKAPLILVGQSNAYLVYGIKKTDYASGYRLLVLNDGRKEEIDLIEWKTSTNNACLMKIDIE